MTGNLFFLADRKTSEAAIVAETATREAFLVGEILAGRLEAFDELYKMFAPMVHGIVLARVPRDEAPDLVQEIFIQAYKSLASLREPNRVGAWLAMIARNRAAEFFRRVKPTEEISENLSHNDASPKAHEILSVIRTLPETYRETLILRLVEGMTGDEIARQTGLKPESVRVNLHRGMKMLRKKLGIVN